LVAGLAGLVWAIPTAARAAQPIFQAPELVWETTGRTSGPQIVVDAAGRAHLFFQDATEAGEAVALYHVDLDGGPPYAPNDVLVGIGADYRDYRLAADPFGNVHALFVRESRLWHAMAPGDAAGDAGRWSEAVSLGTAAPGAELAVDAEGRVHVCFPRGAEVRYVRSDDGGATWGADELVAAAEFPAIAVYLACAADAAGAVHVAWAEAEPPSFYPSKGVWYAGSDDGGASWSAPEPVAGEHYTLPELLADGSGAVHMLWQADIGLGGRQYRRQDAGADGWSAVETVVPVGRGGMSGDAPLAVDGDGGVHAVTSAPEPVWVGRGAAGWGEAVPLAAALAGEPNALDSIEHPAFAIQDGNVAHVAFAFDFKRIYHVAGLLDAAEARSAPKEEPAAMVRRRLGDVPLEPAAGDADDGAGAAAVSSPGAPGLGDSGSAASAVTTTDEVSWTATEPGAGAGLGAGSQRWLIWVGPAAAMLLVVAVVLRRGTQR